MPRSFRRLIDLAELIPETTANLNSREPIDRDVIQTVALSRPAVLVPVAFAQEESMGPLGEEVSLSEPSASWTGSTLVMSSAPVALAAADDRGMIAGAYKRDEVDRWSHRPKDWRFDRRGVPGRQRRGQEGSSQ